MAEGEEAPQGPVRARLWDGPTRIVHWALVALFVFSWVAAENRWMDLHRLSGYAVMGLVLFRLYWGVCGSQTARFASFVRGPKAVIAYARTMATRDSVEHVGHNPVGAVSIVLILLLLVAQVSFGLFAVDIDGLESGPLSYLVDFDTGRQFSELHETSFHGLQIVILLHVAAVIFYLVYKKQNLIHPMLSGKRMFPADPGLTFAPWWRALLGVVIAAAIAWFVSKGLRL